MADEVGNANDALRALGERIRRGTSSGISAKRQEVTNSASEIYGRLNRKIESVTELYARRRREAEEYAKEAKGWDL